jgi:dihydrofolate synthase / folylpolyglutamate synthase
VNAHEPLNDWLNRLKESHINFSLEAFRTCLCQLDLIAPKSAVITVSGTNGKGTCASVLEALAHQEGYKVGLFTSPHLHSVTERIRIGRHCISEVQLYDYIKVIDNAVEATLSYFEILACAALMAFNDAQCDILILEAGLGGRLDAMNALDFSKARCYVSVVTSIGLDHQEWLGQTRTAIMKEKLGYAREGSSLVFGEEAMPDNGVALLVGSKAKYYCIGADFMIKNNEWISGGSLPVKLPKTTLVKSSLACALQAYKMLGHRFSSDHVARALKQFWLPGRFERWNIEGQEWIFDVAHNSEAMKMLAVQLQQDDSCCDVVILASQSSKTLLPGLEGLGVSANLWIWVESIFGFPRENVDKYLQCHPAKVEYLRDVLAIVESIRRSEAVRVLVTGSFLTVKLFQDACRLEQRKQ